MKIESLRAEDPFAVTKKEKQLEELIHEFLASLLPERSNKLIVFIDELDRCKPDFAVELLEKVKHYFDNKDVMFVFSIHSLALQKTIKHYYGNDFDACKYLTRFFDLQVSIPPADRNRYYTQIGYNGRWVIDVICKAIVEIKV